MTVYVKNDRNSIEFAISDLMNAMKKDYFDWTTGCAAAAGRCILSDINKKMIAEYNDKISSKKGSKYYKIFEKSGGVKCFVVATDKDKKFKKGDILKPAGWAAPARNFARGNILDGGYTIRWTGA